MDTREPINPDDIVAVQEVWFYPETYRFFQDGLRKLKSVLQRTSRRVRTRDEGSWH